MERLISDEERIRRAEDIVERRKQYDTRIYGGTALQGKPRFRLKKLLTKAFICCFIYFGIFYVRNTDNPSVLYVKSNIKDALEKNVELTNAYHSVIKKLEDINNFFSKKDDVKDNNINVDDSGENVEQNTTSSENTEFNEESNQNVSYEMGIGGAIEDLGNNDNFFESISESIDYDVDYVKKNYFLGKPINDYIVTSEFGSRQPSETVSANHKGIDLGAKAGTDIFSSLDGTVIEASSQGDYGTHLKIQTDNIIITYAHCSKLCVKQGDNITKGQKIAEVGATGKATGPHLHFEIRVNSKAINPREIMEL